MKVLIFILITLFSFNSLAQNLLNERIWKIMPRKRAIYVDEGVFHSLQQTTKSTLMAIRHSYQKDKGFERVVLDFNTNTIPKVYGYISGKGKKIYIDLFDTKIHSNISSFGDSKLVRSVDFFPITSESLPIEISLKEQTSLDVFYLKDKGRLVIDIKKN